MTKTRLLVAYSNASTHVATTLEYLNSFRLHSSCDVSYLHATHGAEIDFDLNKFDAILHSYCARLCVLGYVSPQYQDALKRFRGVKLLAVQDEYDRTDTLRQSVRDLQFDVVLTCVPDEGREFVYPRAMFPETEFITVLTGYVPATLKARRHSRTPLAQRPVTIGYRGRELPAYYGRLGFDKFEIGRRMREICVARGIAHDIEMTAERRIHGEAWYEFLGNCCATLGTESGCNVFDFDGSLEMRYQALGAERSAAPSYEEFRRYTDPLEDRISMGQVSPRVFEAAAVGTPMVLFSGHYSGVVAPEEHYIELHKDFSNVDAVLDQIGDFDALTAMAERARNDLIASDRYDYRHFVEMVDGIIDRKRAEKAAPQSRGVPIVQISPDAESQPPTLKEQPTGAPRDIHVFLYKTLYFENERQKHENALQRQEIERLNLVYSKEIVHLRAELQANRWPSLSIKHWLIVNTPRLAAFLGRLKANLRSIWRRLWSNSSLDRE